MPEMSRQERKVVTVLFADLVGFTARSDELDPEDVAGVLEPYHARLRSDLERYGGTVEKFIGDAVMAVFGAPIAHEDDPERAVRAALAIRDWAEEQEGLEVRIAVNTGEALVNLAARPELGEPTVAGDVVNTASRLQSAAPVNGILAGEATYRATRDSIDYREADAVEAKGKASPIAVWEVIDARARVGVDVEQRGRAPLVGRKRELDLLLDTFDRARSEREPQLVTLVGVPGIGKSRLVWELFTAIDRDTELVFWRQGRCLPYGEGVSYWALGEMVKAQAGILDTDSADEAALKLAQAAASAEDGERLIPYLRPLVGLGDDGELGADRRNEAFAAWRRFFEALADQRPLVLVFEDLHWADEGMLDFVDHLVDWTTGVPVLVLGTARPELLERRPAWGGGKLNATTLALSALSTEDAARLVAELLGRALLPAETQAALLARAGGNPLYAEQYVRLFVERGTADELPLPETVQGMIAARLDGLPPEEKALLQDAAVVGKVFWTGSLRGIADRPGDDRALHALERKDFIRRERRSSVGGETEYAFRHILVRDVAYGQIPRANRAEKHRLAAEWLESLSDRPEDVAEMVAHHYTSALEYARAAGTETAALRERAREALKVAGDRAATLGAWAPAQRFLSAALDLWPGDDPSRLETQGRLGRALRWTGELTEDFLTAQRDAALAAGRQDMLAEAEMAYAYYWWDRRSSELVQRHVQAALALVADQPSSPSKAWVLHEAAIHALVAAELHSATALAREAAAVAEEFGLTELLASARITRGSAGFSEGDPAGIADIERGLSLAEEYGFGEIVIRGHKNLGDAVQRNGDLVRATALHESGLQNARRLGDLFHTRWFSGELALDRYFQGRWDEALTLADQFAAEVEAGEPHYLESLVREVRALIALARGDVTAALDESNLAVACARTAGDPQVLQPALALGTRVALAAGRRDEAEQLFAELAADTHKAAARRVPSAGISNVALVASEFRLLPDWLTSAELVGTPWLTAAVAAARGDFTAAADLYASMGTRPDEADARLYAARALVAQGRRAEADEQLRQALAFYREVGATAYLREAESLLAASA